MKRRIYDLQLFTDGGEGGAGGAGAGGAGTSGNGGQGGSAGNPTYSYEQAEQIANARAQHATNAALANYFKQQGMTEDEVTAAIKDYRAKKAAQEPDVAAITRERDDARKELETMKNSNYLRDKGVKGEDLDYVLFKVSQKVDDKTDFKKAADAFLKENPRFMGQGFKVSTSAADGGSGNTQSANDIINSSIRRAFGRN